MHSFILAILDFTKIIVDQEYSDTQGGNTHFNLDQTQFCIPNFRENAFLAKRSRVPDAFLNQRILHIFGMYYRFYTIVMDFLLHTTVRAPVLTPRS